ncbi:ECF transporter S component [Mycoplasmopsis caviae]|uniref:ECF transporter S component n=1 Tax=Mycoplasmopsis caviae TaxID=55603 RepID=A0A3P8LHP5_9BACT|nr:ECF transporter S component [Mycoplasmopsis caviae]UUD35662.1 ECF transporter S component [Mycoplasmopsis caviae]VDR41592.1 Uncharacterised protein [Mycoplasmopsis caviae]
MKNNEKTIIPSNDNVQKPFDQLSFSQKFKQHFAKSFRFSVLDVALAGLLLSFHFVTVMVSRFTILKVFPLEIEVIFFILYGIFFGPFKGSLIAILSDTFVMLMTGTIGTWYYLYALIPVGICILSSLYYFFYRASYLFKIIFPLLIISMGFILLFYTVVTNSSSAGYHYKGRNKPQYLPKKIVLAMLLVYFNFSVVAFVIIFFQLLFAKGKIVKEKWFNYLFVFSIISFIMIIFRWLIGPFVYIKYYNYINGGKRTLNYFGTDYYLVKIPILIKSIFTIPIYSLIMSPIFSVTIYLRNKFLENNNKISY